ncbi:MAG: 30S ribosomal protein S13 [Bacteroidota bacterium]|nr:30S ribosomal protein S13 [Bacteroidota bacterium]
MARIAGVDLPKNKRGEIGLTYIFGIGPSTAKYILDKSGIDRNKKVNQWNDEELNAIRNTITDEFKVEGQLRSEIQMSIKRLLDIACYRGIRHRKGLPVRGQRTRTNSRTRKGKRKTVAGKKKAAAKK